MRLSTRNTGRRLQEDTSAIVTKRRDWGYLIEYGFDAYRQKALVERMVENGLHDDEIADSLGFKYDSVRRVREIRRYPWYPVPIPEDEDDEVLVEGVCPTDLVNEHLVNDAIDEVLSSLTEREEKVLRLRFGLGDGYCRTLEEVGRIFNVTRERVRQIEAKGLRKLRHTERRAALQRLLEKSLDVGEEKLDNPA